MEARTPEQADRDEPGRAALLSRLDVFWGAAIFAALMIPVALSLKTVNLSRGASAAD